MKLSVILELFGISIILLGIGITLSRIADALEKP